jgi:hypothetical protein
MICHSGENRNPERNKRSLTSSCNVVFLISPIHTIFQPEIIKKLLNSNLTCGTSIGGRSVLLGFTADVLAENKPMLHVFENEGVNIVKYNIAGIYEMTMAFQE